MDLWIKSFFAAQQVYEVLKNAKMTDFSSSSPSLRQIDVEFMKRLSHSVNIVPVIAKADTMTIEERQEFKQRVSVSSPTKPHTRPAVPLINAVFLQPLLKESAAIMWLFCTLGKKGTGNGRDWVLPSEGVWRGHGGQERQRQDQSKYTRLFHHFFLSSQSKLPRDTVAEPLWRSFCTQEAMPFAVVGSDKEYQVNGKRVLGRKTPWGIVEGASRGLFSLFPTNVDSLMLSILSCV